MHSRFCVAIGAASIVLLVAPTLAAGAGPGHASPMAPSPSGAQHMIVVYRDGVDARAKAARLGAHPDQVYDTALDGFAADLSRSQAAAAGRDPDIVTVQPDRRFRIDTALWKSRAVSSQVVPTGVQRIGASPDRLPNASRRDDERRRAVNVAVVDTGIDPTHPDLNVVGGYNCTTATDGWVDDVGHGTHVAGTIGALDNRIGVVGVDPGVRLWAVRVFDQDGYAEDSWVLCGVDWVARHADMIDVANMSFDAEIDQTVDDGNCGRTVGDILHPSVCDAVRRGVTIVVAAGNESIDAGLELPAGYPEVITVSAYADYDGKPGGKGSGDCGFPETDDTLAFFSNFGQSVDIAAPGVCILSTVPGNGYFVASGTSMAAPHVAGAAALYIADHPRARPAQVKAALVGTGEPGPLAEDPDQYPEPLLNVRGLFASGSR